MDFFIEHVDIWAAAIPDQPGALASILGTLHDARASPLSIVVRREPDHGGKAVVFVSPLATDREIRAASLVGFNIAHSMHGVRVIAASEPGLAARLTQAVADAGINLHGFSATTIGTRFVAYFSLGTMTDADRVVEILGKRTLAKAA